MRDGTALLKAGHQSPRQVVRDGTALLKAGHQSPRQVVRDGTALLKAGHQSPRQDSYAGWDRLAESGASEPSPGLF